jgi:hypothetical protein
MTIVVSRYHAKMEEETSTNNVAEGYGTPDFNLHRLTSVPPPIYDAPPAYTVSHL